MSEQEEGRRGEEERKGRGREEKRKGGEKEEKKKKIIVVSRLGRRQQWSSTEPGFSEVLELLVDPLGIKNYSQ